MNPDLEQQLRETLARSAGGVTDARRPTLSWEQPVTGGTVTEPAPRRRSRVRTAARFAAPLMVAAAVAGAIVLPGQLRTGDGQAPPSADATVATTAPQLQEVALLAPGSTVPLQPGQYLYSKTTFDNEDKHALLITEVWRPQHAADPWTRRFTQLDSRTGELYRDEVTGEVLLEPETVTSPCGDFDGHGGTCDDAGSMDDPTPQFLTTLPKDPVRLRDTISAWALDRFNESIELQMAQTPELSWADVTDSMRAGGVMQGFRTFAEATNGMSQPFSALLQQAVATLPDVVAGDEDNVLGRGAVSYSQTETYGDGTTSSWTAMIFDADGNYIGDAMSDISVGAADQAGVAPPGM